MMCYPALFHHRKSYTCFTRQWSWQGWVRLSRSGFQMTVTVISQSCTSDWSFDQIRLADEFIFYDDVQLTRGFIIEYKLRKQMGLNLSQFLWRRKSKSSSFRIRKYLKMNVGIHHIKANLKRVFQLPRNKEALKIFDKVMKNDKNLADLNKNSIMEIAKIYH